MTIHPEKHLTRVGGYLRGKKVLEIGCGDGFRSLQLVKFCSRLVGVDPDDGLIRRARTLHSHPRIEYVPGSAEALPFADATFDAAAFVLSLHHIPAPRMSVAIDEALRVVPSGAPIIFIEPGFRGSFFDVDAELDACDGDERLEKAQALAAILSHPGLDEVEEFWDVTDYTFESTRDFIDEFQPGNGNDEHIDRLLTAHEHRLSGERRINVCRASVKSR